MIIYYRIEPSYFIIIHTDRQRRSNTNNKLPTYIFFIISTCILFVIVILKYNYAVPHSKLVRIMWRSVFRNWSHNRLHSHGEHQIRDWITRYNIGFMCMCTISSNDFFKNWRNRQNAVSVSQVYNNINYRYLPNTL